MSAAAAIPAAVPGAGAGDRVELDNHDDAECEPLLKKPRNAARSWAQELDETDGKGALQRMGRQQATIIWKAGSRLQKILDKSGGGPGLGGMVSIAVFKAPVKLAGTHMTQKFTKSRGAPFDQTGYYTGVSCAPFLTPTILTLFNINPMKLKDGNPSAVELEAARARFRRVAGFDMDGLVGLVIDEVYTYTPRR
jgi:hypothetical protein